MKTILLTIAAVAALAVSASAQPAPRYRMVVPVQGDVSADEWRDDQEDQVERRQRMERRALRFRQLQERRFLGVDGD